jgi:hypothetical protein
MVDVLQSLSSRFHPTAFGRGLKAYNGPGSTYYIIEKTTFFLSKITSYFCKKIVFTGATSVLMGLDASSNSSPNADFVCPPSVKNLTFTG